MTFLNPNTLIQLDREIVEEGGLAEFVRLSWHLVEPGELIWNWHIDLICYYLEMSLKDPRYKDIIICIPPGCMKTLLCSVFFPAWVWTHSPEKKFIYASYAQSLSNKSAKQHRDIVTSDWYQQRWGTTCSFSKDSITQVQWFENNQHGFRYSTSVGGQLTGRHADILVFDDLLKAQDAFNIAAIERANDFWFGTMATRQSNPKKTIKIGIMQRLHTDDPASRCLEVGYKALILPMKGPYLHHKGTQEPLQAIQTQNLALGSSKASEALESFIDISNTIASSNKITEDPRVDYEELLWESRFDYQAIETLRKSLGPVGSAAQLDQNPVPLSGALFQLEDFQRRYDQIPDGCQYVMGVDCSFEDEKTAINPDYVVIQVWAYKKPNFYLVDQTRKKMNFIDTCKAIVDMQHRHPQVTSVIVEKKANGAAVMNVLSEHISGLKPYPPKGERQPSKIEKANACQPLMQNVWYPQDNIAPYMSDYIKELLQFPASANDDQCDVTSMVLLTLHKPQQNAYINSLKNIGFNNKQIW